MISLLAFSLIATFITKWLVARLRHSKSTPARRWTAIIADLIWVLLIFAAGVIATRYIERISNEGVGYLVFGCVATFLSLFRAFLYVRAQEQRKPRKKLDIRKLLHVGIHTLNHLLFSAVLYLALSLLSKGPADPMLFIPTFIGALLPGLDSQNSALGRLLPLISKRLETRTGHRQEWHSLGANALVAAVSAPLIPLIGLHAWLLIPLGFLSHLLLDMLQPQGIMLFWPVSRTRYSMLRGFAESHGSSADWKLVVVLTAVAAVLVFVADVHRPRPPAIAAPSFESSFERYLSLRGRNLAFADIDGTWQATGRRVSARFEILSAMDRSLIMLDRFSGEVFTAGRTGADNLYLNAMSVVAGSSVRVKPVEIALHNDRLAEALPVVYQMQSEPGLQHIFVSGEVVAATGHDDATFSVQVDYAQTQLRRIQELGERHYGLCYLTAGDLIELADVSVEIADLVIVATYVSPAAGPTPTPLPSPPAIPGEAP